MEKQKKPANDDRHQQPWKTVEWIVGGICGLFVAALIGFLAVEAVLDHNGRPMLRIEAGELRPAGDHQVLEIKVINDGDATASDVIVAGVLGEETSSVVLDYVPPGPGVDAALVFQGDASAAAPDLRVEGYTHP